MTPTRRPRRNGDDAVADCLVSGRSRIVAFGSAAALILAGILAAILIGDGTGQLLAIVLIGLGLGLVLATSLVFLEVGLSEDRERTRESSERKRPRQRSGRTSLDRMRGRGRRLK